MLKVKEAGVVALLLSLFTVKSSVGINNKSTIGSPGADKVKPAILKRFVLTQIK